MTRSRATTPPRARVPRRPSPEPIFGKPAELPRGPHTLSRDEVGASQRTRLMAALAELAAERGYAETTVAEVSRRAGVAPNTFYAHFRDKLDCYLAAYDTLIEVLWTRMFGDLDAGSDWHDVMLATLTAYLDTLEQNPGIARAALIEIDGAGPAARAHRRRAFEQSAALLKNLHQQMRRQDPSLGPLPDRVYMSILHGARELVRDAIESGRPRRLTELAPDILYWITATVRGAGAAAAELGEPH